MPITASESQGEFPVELFKLNEITDFMCLSGFFLFCFILTSLNELPAAD